MDGQENCTDLCKQCDREGEVRGMACPLVPVGHS